MNCMPLSTVEQEEATAAETDELLIRPTPISSKEAEEEAACFRARSARATNLEVSCELISLHGLYLEEQGTRSAAGSVFRRGNGSLSEPLANGLMDCS